MHPYKTVERVLARMFGDDGAAALRVSNRIRHFVRLNFTPEKPGKGRHISYSREDVAKWAYGLKVLEFGLDPIEMLPVVERSWPKVWPVIERGRWGMNELAILTPSAISHPTGWHTLKVDVKVGHMYAPDWSRVDRVMIINLGRLTKDLNDALSDAESGNLRDLSEEIEKIKASDAVGAQISAALKNITPGAELHVGSINGSALVRERGADGVLRDVLPTPRKGKRSTAASTAEVDGDAGESVKAPADLAAGSPEATSPKRGRRLVLDRPDPVPVEMPKRERRAPDPVEPREVPRVDSRGPRNVKL